MDKQVIWQHLHDMGYRPLEEDRKLWAKPWGYTICTFDVDTRTWQQTYRRADDGQAIVWSKVTWDERDHHLVEWLGHAEIYHTHQITFGTPWAFCTQIQLKR